MTAWDMAFDEMELEELWMREARKELGREQPPRDTTILSLHERGCPVWQLAHVMGRPSADVAAIVFRAPAAARKERAA